MNSHSEIFASRRRQFMAEIDGAVAILPSAPVAIRSGDVEFIYRQDNDFYYLTGLAEPESIAVFAPGQKDEFVLFVRPRDKERETWTGRRVGVEGALRDYGASRAYVVEDFPEFCPLCSKKPSTSTCRSDSILRLRLECSR